MCYDKATLQSAPWCTLLKHAHAKIPLTLLGLCVIHAHITCHVFKLGATALYLPLHRFHQPLGKL